ncbi:MAG: DEAD/DEAH box helicase family protein [Clostridiales bacterium]|nr:DEAD/DEAH box helicase family protein [Clostridiales bacterium]
MKERFIMLGELELKFKYRSDSDHLIDDFYTPVLKNSSLYCRAVGYFTSSSLALAAQGMSNFINRNGEIRIVASPKLNREDIEAINLGEKSKEQIIEDILLKELVWTENDIVNYRLKVLAWLIANRKLEIRIAVFDDINANGFYHEKIGYFEDDNRNRVGFIGSSNETHGGLFNNFESIQVFNSKNDFEVDRINDLVYDFDRLWSNDTNKLRIMKFDKISEKLLEFYDADLDPIDIESKLIDFDNDNLINIPSEYKLRPYQYDAIQSWVDNNYHGLFSMATGTGKTITALSSIVRLRKEINENLLVIISCPYIHLVDQWFDDAILFGFKPIIAYTGQKWVPKLKRDLRNLKIKDSRTTCLIVCNATFETERMQRILDSYYGKVLFVIDEAHNFGSENKLALLNVDYEYRLALSATPERHFDEEGTQKLFDYFGGIVYEFTLEEAIKKGYLTNYYYYPLEVSLTDDEYEKYSELSLQISRLLGSKDDSMKKKIKDNPILQSKLIERARILALADNKIELLRSEIKVQKDTYYNLVYCGSGASKINVEQERQIDKVCRVLGNELEMSIHKFTSDEDRKLRKEIIDRYKTGDDLQAIVAIKCLDEGVNIPQIEKAYIMASSTNYREFVQRRGRVLRTAPNKKFAYIYDFITLPKPISELNNMSSENFNVEKQIVKRELARIKEFAKLAVNNDVGMDFVEYLEDIFGIVSEEDGYE